MRPAFPDIASRFKIDRDQDGTPMAVKAITSPSGVAVTLTFQDGIGQPTQTQPTQPATYRVTAVITDPDDPRLTSHGTQRIVA